MLEVISDVLPLSYAVDAMQDVASSTATGEVWRDIALIAAFVVAGPAPSAPSTAAPPDGLTAGRPAPGV